MSRLARTTAFNLAFLGSRRREHKRLDPRVQAIIDSHPTDDIGSVPRKSIEEN
jgi:hypothetical protein